VELTTTQHGNEVTTEYNQEDLAVMTNAKSLEELAAAIRQLAATPATACGGCAANGCGAASSPPAPPGPMCCCTKVQPAVLYCGGCGGEGDESSPVAAVKAPLKREAAKRAAAARPLKLPEATSEAAG
jgi:hypothetical protein